VPPDLAPPSLNAHVSLCCTDIYYQLFYWPLYLRLMFVIDLLYIQTISDITPDSWCLLFALLSCPLKFQVISPRLFRRHFGEFLSHRAYQGHTAAVTSLSEKDNITVQFLIMLTLYFTSEVRGRGLCYVSVKRKETNSQ
jgi:hypothetical protein